MKLVHVLTSEAPGTIHWLEEAGVEFTRSNGGYRLARCGGASRHRLLQVGDQTGLAITERREAVESSSALVLPKSPLTELEQTGSSWRARCGDTPSRPAPSCSRPAAAASARPRSGAS